MEHMRENMLKLHRQRQFQNGTRPLEACSTKHESSMKRGTHEPTGRTPGTSQVSKRRIAAYEPRLHCYLSFVALDFRLGAGTSSIFIIVRDNNHYGQRHWPGRPPGHQ